MFLQVPVKYQFINKLNEASFCKPWLKVEPACAIVNIGECVRVQEPWSRHRGPCTMVQAPWSRNRGPYTRVHDTMAEVSRYRQSLSMHRVHAPWSTHHGPCTRIQGTMVEVPRSRHHGPGAMVEVLRSKHCLVWLSMYCGRVLAPTLALFTMCGSEGYHLPVPFSLKCPSHFSTNLYEIICIA